MSIEMKIEALTEALTANSALLTRVVAGQEVALAKLEAGVGTTPRKPRATAADKAATAAAPAEAEVATETAATVHPLLAAPNGETAKNAKQEDEPTANYRAADFSRQEVKNEFIGWLGSTSDPAVRATHSAFVKSLGENFGVAQIFSPTDGLKDEDQFKQVLFFLRREREGLKVDFAADYDFDGDPLADQTAAEVEEPSAADELG